MAVQAQFIQEGDAIDYTPGADVAAGVVVVLSDLVGVTKRDIKANKLGALAVTGVFDLAKEAGGGVTFAIGDKVYWDDANDVAVATDSAGANKLFGKAVAAAADGDSTVRARLSQ
jgi:predicted RecA/RadA family phage recombinase